MLFTSYTRPMAALLPDRWCSLDGSAAMSPAGMSRVWPWSKINTRELPRHRHPRFFCRREGLRAVSPDMAPDCIAGVGLALLDPGKTGAEEQARQ